MHMFWECPTILDICVHCPRWYSTPRDTTGSHTLPVTGWFYTHQKRTLLAVGTAAKNTVLKDTTTSTTFTWLSYFRDITLIEGTTCQA